MLIDILLIFFIVFGFWIGYSRGILSTLLYVTIYLLALILTLIISPHLAEFISNTFPIGKLFALIFGTIGIFILISYLLTYLTKRVNKRTGKGRKDLKGKVPGGIIMMLFSIILCGLLIGGIGQLNLIKPDTKEASKTYPHLKQIPVHAVTLVETFKPIFQNYWHLMEEAMQQSKRES